jgi:hypothetical protein
MDNQEYDRDLYDLHYLRKLQPGRRFVRNYYGSLSVDQSQIAISERRRNIRINQRRHLLINELSKELKAIIDDILMQLKYLLDAI